MLPLVDSNKQQGWRLPYSVLPWIRLTPALLLILLFVLVGVASLIALLLQGSGQDWGRALFSSYLWRIIRFSLLQATLSAALSLMIAIPVTSALMHRRFLGREALLGLFAVCNVVPTIVAVLGIVVVYGRSGWVQSLLDGLALDMQVPLYGLTGILLAHVFFNFPLAVRFFIQSYQLVPSGQWRLANQLGFTRMQAFRIIEWHYIRKALPGVFVLIFMLCFTSFAVVLSLGGGPRASTLEVAIYQALRFEFDIPKATLLSMLQIAICTLVALVVYRLSPVSRQDFSLSGSQTYPVRDSRSAKVFDGVIIGIAILVVIPPFMAIFAPLFSSEILVTLSDHMTWTATWTSLRIAVPAATLSVVLGLGFAYVARFTLQSLNWPKLTGKLEHLGNVILMVPALVLATGLFLLFRALGYGFEAGYWIVVWVNAVMALPFVLRALTPDLYQQELRYRLLYQSLDLWGWYRLRLEWPFIRKAVGQAFGFALLLSLGDMGVIALFGSDGLVTLPLHLFRLIGSYRLNQGACVAVLLVSLCFLLFYLSSRLIGGRRVIR